MNHLTATYLVSGFSCCRKEKWLFTSRERSLFSFASEPPKQEQGATLFFVVLSKSNIVTQLATLRFSPSSCCPGQTWPSCCSKAVQMHLGSWHHSQPSPCFPMCFWHVNLSDMSVWKWGSPKVLNLLDICTQTTAWTLYGDDFPDCTKLNY